MAVAGTAHGSDTQLATNVVFTRKRRTDCTETISDDIEICCDDIHLHTAASDPVNSNTSEQAKDGETEVTPIDSSVGSLTNTITLPPESEN